MIPATKTFVGVSNKSRAHNRTVTQIEMTMNIINLVGKHGQLRKERVNNIFISSIIIRDIISSSHNRFNDNVSMDAIMQCLFYSHERAVVNVGPMFDGSLLPLSDWPCFMPTVPFSDWPCFMPTVQIGPVSCQPIMHMISIQHE